MDTKIISGLKRYEFLKFLKFLKFSTLSFFLKFLKSTSKTSKTSAAPPLFLFCTITNSHLEGAVLTLTIWKLLAGEPRQMALIITAVLAALHVALILLFKMYFFAQTSKAPTPAPVPTR
eukprot:sb/3476340/